MDRSIARRLLAAGLVLGLLAEVVLDGSAFGVNILVARGGDAARGLAGAPSGHGRPTRSTPGCRSRRSSSRRSSPSAATRSWRCSTRSARWRSSAPPWRPCPGCPSRAGPPRSSPAMAAWTLGAVVAGAPRVAVAARTGPITAPGWASGLAARWWLPLIARPPHRPAAGAHLRGPVRVGRPDLPARRWTTCSGWQLDLGSLAEVARVFTLACAWLAAGLLMVAATGIPAVRARLAGRGRPDAAGDRRGRLGAHGGDRRPGRRRPRRRPVRRAPDRLPVRWPEHARGGRHDLQRLRAARLLRARRGGLPGGRRRRRPRDDASSGGAGRTSRRSLRSSG